MGQIALNEISYMEQVLRLAKRGRGYTSPNPMVGSLIVKNGHIIGQGYHRRFGEKHAEIMAIDNATESCEGGVLYCNLEPCTADIPNKKTPPCTDRIIQEKITKVIISTIDPNPYVNGRGITILRKNNIDVKVGLLAEKAISLNEKYFHFTKTGRPFVHLKIAQSLDGRIATYTGNSKWITNNNALRKVHQLRAEYDAILIGIKTVLQDNPSLTIRKARGNNPFRIILDNEFHIPEEATVISDNYSEKTIIFTGKVPNKEKMNQFRQRGITIISMDSNPTENLDLKKILEELAKRNITSLLVEGGGEIFTSFIKKKLYNKISVFTAPLIIGSGIQSIGDLGITSLSEAHQLEKVHIKKIDHQILLEGYRDLQSVIP
jgi:diaminohydroxyphosphoribosylaminopyrimidine deaminase/5-amino-6-(5-phosphoribosylamino)uracil reductase